MQNTSDVARPEAHIEASVNTFFTDLFPLVYNHAINLHKDFGEDYKTCLRQMIEEVQPFGDIPKQISSSVFKSLEAMRMLLQGLTLGSEVLGTADSLLSENAEKADGSHAACQLALLKMSYCPRCLGLESRVKPCSGLCLNVLRGCLTQQVSELDYPWNAFVDVLERLVIAMKSHDTGSDVNVDTVIRGLDTRISEAIMYAMENGPSLEKKVCKFTQLLLFHIKNNPHTIQLHVFFLVYNYGEIRIMYLCTSICESNDRHIYNKRQ